MADPVPPRHSRVSLRTRITSWTSAVVFLVLSAGAIAVVELLDSSLLDAESQTAELQAEQYAQEYESTGRLPEVDSDELIVQVQVDGAVIAVSDDDAVDAPALPVADDERVVTLDGDRFLVRSEDLDDDGSVVVARSLDVVDEARSSATSLMLVAVPAVTAFIAVIVWIVVGRSLRPVERIRRDVESVGDDLSRRILEPGRDEVARLATTMNHLLDKLESAAKTQRRFVSDASHELRSPVAAIRAHTQLALHHPESTDLSSMAGVIDSEAARLHDLVDDLLLLARLDEGLAPHRVEVDLDDIVFAEAGRLRSLGVKADTLAVGAARVLADQRLLARAVRNIAENARRHTRTVVAFSLTVDNNTVVLRVDDDGDGVPEQDRERIFRRFERRDDARSRDDGGSGLGLAIVVEAAVHSGGAATMTSSPAGGARVELRLPHHLDA